ncbi:hypothetical protein J2X68_001469 [Streptomyces sp. 3330]|uniref:hypothetical protein n=1 Tax=Streptomyces sp. 3330 TaxID=2817755 RepID=UPI00285764F9|nr:hypothetical protein [Streptomyces sp. 3330]MDR6974791.1 hypothetical protein [Streptomyces sp. 3330]
MGFFDRLTGTRHPRHGLVPRSAEEVRAALFAVNGPEVPFLVREALPGERADLVAEWRVREPSWHAYFVRTRMQQTLKTRMRLVPGTHEVRTVDEWREVTWVGNPPRLALAREFGRGQVNTVSRQWAVERGPDGRRRLRETYRFDSAQMKDPLRAAVLAAGWVWRGVTFGRL